MTCLDELKVTVNTQLVLVLHHHPLNTSAYPNNDGPQNSIYSRNILSDMDILSDGSQDKEPAHTQL
ncbi:hypothetical protein MJO28_007717 [Puccinia striiformis f. sp. tritici]|uniref:Uncharacterized protein n=1 Tax=Puccinia striiformis f. sp. tritici TaxID=168172 RepID=A0ACC0EGG7_9BASI|nr:hypothetical protein MJO28_007717 [Puccinia striiformis f. sp. tritici]